MCKKATTYTTDQEHKDDRSSKKYSNFKQTNYIDN